MNQIQSPPNEYDFGLDFNYAAWTKNTVVTMVNVPWNNDYRDIVKFANRAALNAYLDSIEGAGVQIGGMSYVKPNTPIRIPIPFNAAYKYNYLRASNPLQAVAGDVQKDYYYFITDVRYVAPDTTEVVLQLDVWQTFGFDATFGNCYIERGHIGIANENAFQNYGRDFLTIPEGIDTGTEYQVVTQKSKSLMSYEFPDGATGIDDVTGGFDVLVVSAVDLLATDFGTVDAPILTTAKGGNYFGLPSGADYYLFNGGDNSFPTFMTAMQDFPWITQGIISITVIPKITKYYPTFTFTAFGTPTHAPSGALPPRIYTMYPDWRDDYLVVHHVPDRYLGLKKLFTYPYMAVELTTFTGTPIIIKPESWNDPDARVLERFNPLPPSQRIAIGPYKYNAVNAAPTEDRYPGFPSSDPIYDALIVGGDDHGDYIDFATQMNNLPTLAIVNNAAIGYLAANAHGIAFQNASAGWTQQRALRGNETSYDQSTRGMNTANELANIGISRDTSSTLIGNNLMGNQAALSAITGIAGGMGGGLSGGMAGAAVGAVGGAASAAAGMLSTSMGIDANNQQLSVRNNAANMSNKANLGNQGYVRDTNKSLADYSARGDYENSIAGVNAKVQDANLIQPTTSGQVGGDAMNIVMNNAFVSMRIKMLDYANMRIVGEYWLRYGYAVRQFFTPPASLQVMSKFTYWKLSETYISASTMPESFKQVIRGIFEKGVTVWANPAFIGVTDIGDNAPLGGISL